MALGSGDQLTGSQRVGYAFLCTGLVLFSGLMSGLTLGLLSLDRVDLEARTKVGPSGPLGRPLTSTCALCLARAQVLKRSGTETQKKHAAAVAPVRAALWFPALWAHNALRLTHALSRGACSS
jgi:hypothetical protein